MPTTNTLLRNSTGALLRNTEGALLRKGAAVVLHYLIEFTIDYECHPNQPPNYAVGVETGSWPGNMASCYVSSAAPQYTDQKLFEYDVGLDVLSIRVHFDGTYDVISGTCTSGGTYPEYIFTLGAVTIMLMP